MTESVSQSPTVAFVLPSLAGGGAERAVLNLAEALGSARAVVLAEHSAGELVVDPAARQAKFAGFAPAGRIRRIHRLARALREVDPDLVVSPVSPVVAGAAARFAQAPVIHWLQNPLLSDIRFAHRVGVAILRELLRRDAMVAAASPGLVVAMTDLGIPPNQVALLPNPILLAPIQPSAPKTSWHEPVRLISVARLAPQKRHDLLLDALRSLLAERPVELHLVGTGPLELELRDQVRQLGLWENVRFHGFVPDPSRLIADADVLVLASDYEGFGNVLVEALAIGTPVVATDAPHGPRFILGDGRYGELVRVGSSAAIAAGVSQVLSLGPADVVRMQQLREQAERFAIEPVTQRFNQICDLALRNVSDSRGLSDW